MLLLKNVNICVFSLNIAELAVHMVEVTLK